MKELARIHFPLALNDGSIIRLLTLSLFVLEGVEPSHLCFHPFSPPSRELSDWSRRKTGETQTAAQHAVGNGVPC